MMGRPNSRKPKTQVNGGILSKANSRPLKGDHEYFITRYKTSPCRKRGCQDKAFCFGFHHPAERRRNPRIFSAYSEEPCTNLKDKNSGKWRQPSRCKNGDRCRRSHTILEVMYHPNVYKTQKCSNYFNPKGNKCTWGSFCTHAHDNARAKSKNGRLVGRSPGITEVSAQTAKVVPQKVISNKVLNTKVVVANAKVVPSVDVAAKAHSVKLASKQKPKVTLELSPAKSMSIMKPVESSAKPSLSYSAVTTMTYSAVTRKVPEGAISPSGIFPNEPFAGVPWPHLYNSQRDDGNVYLADDKPMPRPLFPIHSNSNSLFSIDNGIWAFGNGSDGGSPIPEGTFPEISEAGPKEMDDLWDNLCTPSVVSMDLQSGTDDTCSMSPPGHRSPVQVPVLNSKLFSPALPFSKNLQQNKQQLRMRELADECTSLKSQLAEIKDTLKTRMVELRELSALSKTPTLKNECLVPSVSDNF